MNRANLNIPWKTGALVSALMVAGCALPANYDTVGAGYVAVGDAPLYYQPYPYWYYDPFPFGFSHHHVKRHHHHGKGHHHPGHKHRHGGPVGAHQDQGKPAAMGEMPTAAQPRQAMPQAIPAQRRATNFGSTGMTARSHRRPVTTNKSGGSTITVQQTTSSKSSMMSQSRRTPRAAGNSRQHRRQPR